MKKLLLICMMALSVLSAKAQESSGSLSITANDNYACGAAVIVSGSFIASATTSSPIMEHTWKLIPCDDDGNPDGEEVYSITNTGEPNGDFMFPGSEMLPAEKRYMVTLSATDAATNIVYAPPIGVIITSYTLAANSFYPCGQYVTANGAFYASPAVPSLPPMSHRWEVYTCDALGNNTFPGPPSPGIPFYNQFYSNSVPTGTYTFTSSDQWVCNQYLKMVLTFYNANTNAVLAVRTKVFYIGNGQINGPNGYCCSGWISPSANYFQGPGNPQASSHIWSIAPCLQNGQQTGPVISQLISPVQQGTIVNGVYNASTYFFPNSWPYISCANYYLIMVYFYDANNTIITTTSKVVYLSPNPVPVISGPANVCGTGVFCETNVTGPGNVYLWNQAIGYPGAIPGSNNTSCVTVPFPSIFAGLGLTVINQYGCSGQAGFQVTNGYVNPDFTVTTAQIGGGQFKIQVNRIGALPIGVTDQFKVERYIINTQTPVLSSTLTNLNWSNYSPIVFDGYDASVAWNGLVAPLAYNASSPFGKFYNGQYYRITRTINSACPLVEVKVVDQFGVCVGCRFGSGEIVENSIIESSPFSVFPNPSNGNFQIQLAENAENAQVEMYNLMGEQVDAFTINSNTYAYAPKETLASGVYLLRVTTNGVSNTQRIIIE
ncbi:MAG: T9SS type A sorting domain-containing protein [Bacteroidia bacterium]